MTMTETTTQDGRVVAIAGPVIDVEFPRGSLPELNNALEFEVTIEGVKNVIWLRLRSNWATVACALYA